MSKLAQDVKDAIIEYQVSSDLLVTVATHCLINVKLFCLFQRLAGGHRTPVRQLSALFLRVLTSLIADLLNSCRHTQTAEYCHRNHRGCLKGIRDAVLNSVSDQELDSKNMCGESPPREKSADNGSSSLPRESMTTTAVTSLPRAAELAQYSTQIRPKVRYEPEPKVETFHANRMTRVGATGRRSPRPWKRTFQGVFP